VPAPEGEGEEAGCWAMSLQKRLEALPFYSQGGPSHAHASGLLHSGSAGGLWAASGASGVGPVRSHGRGWRRVQVCP